MAATYTAHVSDPTRDIEIEVKVGRIQEIIIVTIQEKGVEIEVEIGVVIDKCIQEQEHYLMRGQVKV